MKRILHKKKKVLKYGFLSISLVLLFWFLSVFELYITFSEEGGVVRFLAILMFKFINDAIAVLIIAVLCFPSYIILEKLKNKLGLYIMTSLFVILIFVQLGLVKYSSTTLLNLGADILGYSLDDIFLTVKSSGPVSFISLLFVVLLPAVFLLLINFFKRKMTGNMVSVFVVSLLLLSVGCYLFNTEISKRTYQNKLSFLVIDIVKFQVNKNEINDDFQNRNDYPFLKPFDKTKDVLSPFFKLKKERPNIVIVVLEGMGGEFVGDNDYAGFTPYLDSLISKSLYWPNFLSTTGRSFGVLPSLMGSLPYGEKGFLELEELPSHLSLINVLKSNGYTTSFYAGHQSSFDKKINFLEHNGIDYVVDENNFGKEYEKAKKNSDGYSWGYPDAEIYRKTLSVLDKRKKPRLDIIVTLSNHEPFEFPKKETYLEKVDALLNSSKKIKADRRSVETYKSIYASLLYTDQALAKFMEGYAARPDFENTIFIITGDHRLIPIAQKDQLCRYHVPLFIYSPMLKRVETFKSISSHLDVAPTVLSFLMNNYDFNEIEKTAWIGKGIDTAQNFRNIQEIPFMKYKGVINDFVYKHYMYSDGELYKIKENFGTYKVINDSLLNVISGKLKKFKEDNSYVTKRNRIFPDSLNIYTTKKYKFTKEEQQQIVKITKGFNFDEVFMMAREKAFSKNFETAKLLCVYILSKLPNHVDARILKGRILAWSGAYKEAEKEFLIALERTPYYDDVYLALLDLYWWSDQDEKSESLGVKANRNKIVNADVSFKLAKAYSRINKKDKAVKLLDSVLKVHTDSIKYRTFLQNLK